MRARVTFFAGVMMTAGVFAASAASEEATPPALIYTLWTKTCFTGMCLTGVSGEPASGCGPVFAAALTERSGETKKFLRVTVPSSVDQARGVHVGIDRDRPIERPYLRCDAKACSADVEAGTQMIDRLKHGRLLVLEAVDTGNAPMRFELPLADFALAYDGPAYQPPPFRVVSHQEMLAVETRLAREKAEREARCGPR
jgi:invasion protein IalB